MAPLKNVLTKNVKMEYWYKLRMLTIKTYFDVFNVSIDIVFFVDICIMKESAIKL